MCRKSSYEAWAFGFRSWKVGVEDYDGIRCVLTIDDNGGIGTLYFCMSSGDYHHRGDGGNDVGTQY